MQARGSSRETCPISTEGWTRRVHFVREGKGGGVPPVRRAAGGAPRRGARSARPAGPAHALSPRPRRVWGWFRGTVKNRNCSGSRKNSHKSKGVQFNVAHSSPSTPPRPFPRLGGVCVCLEAEMVLDREAEDRHPQPLLRHKLVLPAHAHPQRGAPLPRASRRGSGGSSSGGHTAVAVLSGPSHTKWTQQSGHSTD